MTLRGCDVWHDNNALILFLACGGGDYDDRKQVDVDLSQWWGYGSTPTGLCWNNVVSCSMA